MDGITIRVFVTLLAGASACFAQDVAKEPVKDPAQSRTRVNDEIEIPLPFSSPRAIQAGTREPLSAQGKVNLAFRNTFSPRVLANRLLLAGLDSMNNTQEEWPSGAEGFGMRLGNRMGALATRNAIQLGFDVMLHTEPRYDVCSCKGFLPRTGHAFKRSFTSLTDSGNEVVSVSRLAGSLATPWVTHQWLPDRLNTTSRKWQSGGVNIGLRGVTNMVREFWPDLARTMHLPARFRKQDVQN